MSQAGWQDSRIAGWQAGGPGQERRDNHALVIGGMVTAGRMLLLYGKTIYPCD
jgi:hypothetical protein